MEKSNEKNIKKSMKVTLINPNIITQKNDFFGTGIPFLPITLASTAAYLREKKYALQVIDAFGEDPQRITNTQDFFIQGLSTEEIVQKIAPETEAIILYASLVITHNANLQLIKLLKEKFALPIIVIENVHSVVGYSLLKTQDDFFQAGADYLVLADPEEKVENILQALSKQKAPSTNGIIFKQHNLIVNKPLLTYPKNLDALPFPAWELFPLKNYWNLAYAHAPMNKNYLPLLTSRGCPNNCEFCITPQMFGRTWRARSAKNVVDEIEYYVNKFQVREFHIEDFNPTVSKERIKEICQEIIRRGLKVNLKIAAGTKAETIDEETLDWMKKGGFSYISISPETGSAPMLGKMNKQFDHEHGLKLVRHMHQIGIISQACFVIGFPGEEKEDLQLTRKYIQELVKVGLDEMAMFIMIPIPGSRACEYSPLGYKNLSQLTFSPKWRESYKELRNFRNWSYVWFFFWKLRSHPEKMLQHIYNICTKNFQTKIEMAFWRVMRMNLMGRVRKRF